MKISEVAWLCAALLVHETVGVSLRRAAPIVNATAEVEGAVSAILSGRSAQSEVSRLPQAGLAEAESQGATSAVAQLGLAGHDLAGAAAAFAIQSSGQGGTNLASPMDEATIKKAVASLNSIMGKTWLQLDERVIACSAMREKNAQWRDQLDLDLVGASDELARITGIRTQAVTGIQGAEDALAKLGAGWAQQVRTFNMTNVRISRAKIMQEDDIASLKQTISLTKCQGSAAASFLADGGKDASASQGLVKELCRIESTLAKESRPHELQHLKCSFGRLGCADLHLAAVKLLAQTTDALEDLDLQSRKAYKDDADFRENLVAHQEELRAHKMELEQGLAEAVSRMSSMNELRRSLSQEVRTHLRDSRAHQAQCKTAVRMVFETMCGLRKIRSFLSSKSSQIKLDDVVDCDVTDWQPGECSATCDDVCPGKKTDGKPCGGESILTREVIQAAGVAGMACPALTKTTACNQVKCPVQCQVSGWSNFTSCTRECGGGLSTKTRSVIQLPQNGGEACGPLSESKPCGTSACRACALKPWSSWSSCSAGCSGGLQVRTRDPLDPSDEEPQSDQISASLSSSSSSSANTPSASRELPCPTCSLGPPAALLEVSKAKCPSRSGSSRYEEKACMAQTCKENDRCVDDQDIIFAIDGSASLSESAFTALRSFAVDLVGRYKAPNNIGVMQFGNGDLSADGVSISGAVKVSDLGGSLVATSSAIRNLKLLGGLPNMPQALELAGSMFGNTNRQKTFVFITNSKPLYRHKVFEEAARLRRQGVRVFVVAASDTLLANDFEIIKEMASRPIDANFFHIEALTGPGANPLSHVAAVLGKTCSKVQ